MLMEHRGLLLELRSQAPATTHATVPNQTLGVSCGRIGGVLEESLWTCGTNANANMYMRPDGIVAVRR